MTARRRTVAALAAFAAIAAALAWRAAGLRGEPGNPYADGWALQDFRDAVYWPVRALAAGDNPYDMPAYFARYPVGQEFPLFAPHHLLVHAPWAALPFGVAEQVYFLTTLALTLAFAWLSLRVNARPATLAAVCGLGALILLSRPGHMNLLLGQVALPVAIGCTAAVVLARTRPRLAALGFAVACLKPNFGAPLAVLLLARGDRRVVAGGLALACAASLPVLAVLIANAGGVQPLLAAVLANQASSAATTEIGPTSGWARVDAWALAVRLAPELPIAAQAPFGLAVLLLAALAVRRRAARAVDAAPDLTLLIALAVLASVYHQPYDLLLLVPPLVGLVAARRDGRPAAVPAPLLLAAMLAVPMMNYAVSWPVMRALGGESLAWRLVAALNAGMLLAALLVCIAAALRRPAAVPLRRAAPAVRSVAS